MNQYVSDLFLVLESSLQDASFVKLSLGHYMGNEEALKNIYVKQVIIKRQPHLSFTYRYKTRDIVKNYEIETGIALLKSFITYTHFRHSSLFTTSNDFALELIDADKVKLTTKNSTQLPPLNLQHDKPKNRIIEAYGKIYLYELGITDKQGRVLKNAQDKYRQINHYIELLSSLLKELPKQKTIRIVDMGAGKGYLTFALYDYLNNVLKLNAEVVGVEFREDLVILCNKIAQNSDFQRLRFQQGTIENYKNEDFDVLIALHACDTATDDAIAKGIKANANLIVVAPCCHKQIRREIEKNKTKNELGFLTKYGVFLERQAEMITDGIRALILEYFGYSTKILEFVSDAHTPKNVLIIGQKNKNLAVRNKEIIAKILEIKTYFGISYHHLERASQLQTPPKSSLTEI